MINNRIAGYAFILISIIGWITLATIQKDYTPIIFLLGLGAGLIATKE